ncbi:DMT family transporter [Levilactobacillus tujiorum]|uniref:DMT family transporter n=1 Tax=Levilactobacillus tujiorum TaxID=2912243 RepID=A0ABX1L6T0_9LACO|nr:DMT family transporter [Levilactobacillus tujiorum]MCH5464973.1 DMT family transporter [Levilactobacillus tujiorum]NLR11989.1 DMT family transporter [Lactobacillus sp. HBUAS51387]NLR29963.1 DMT family transporter [Levilactobacillus tujiorum]
MLPITIGIAIGVIVSFQTAVNSRLRHFIGSPYQASLVSFTIGTLFLAIMTFVSQHTLLVAPNVIATQPWWLWIGGLLGVIFLTANILLFPHIGAVQTAIMPILGQVVMGAIIDNFGWFHADRQPLTLTKFVGLLLALAGILITVALPGLLHKRHQLATEKSTGNPFIWRLIGVFTGALGATQTTINGRLGLALHSAIHAAFISFLIGTLGLLVIVLIVNHGLTEIRRATGHGKPWWLWIGGLLGAIFVLGNAYLAPILGTGQTVVFALLGQITGGLLVDQFGLLGAQRKPVAGIQLLGLAVLIVGVMLIRLF